MSTEQGRAFAGQATHHRARTAKGSSSVTRKGRLRRWRLPLIALLCMSVAPVLAWAAARLLIVKSELAAPDAIVVLSGSSTYIERSNWAARLYREGRAPVIILTNDGLIGGWDR